MKTSLLQALGHECSIEKPIYLLCNNFVPMISTLVH